MPLTETANYATERAKLQTTPVYFSRFSHLKKYGDGPDYPFSVDFATGTVAAPTKTKLGHMRKPQGNLQAIDHEQGRSSIGTLPLVFVDVGGEMLRYLAAPALTLKTAMTAGAPGAGGYVEVNEATDGMPAVGTLEITTGGVVERVRYDLRDDAGKRFRVAAAGRGADGTTAASHSINDAITNGEQIRPGQRVQLYAGYAAIDEADYLAVPKMEVISRRFVDGVTLEIIATDIQRALRRTVFVGASPDAPVTLTDNPVTTALKVLTSTGAGTNGAYDTLAAANGLAIPQALVDVAGLETLRAAEFAGETYVFSITGPEDGKAFIEEQIWKTLGCYPVIKQDGKLSAKRAKQTGASVVTLDESTITAWGWAMGDAQIINVVEFEYDWDIADARGVYSKRQIYTADQPAGTSSIDKYGRRPPLSFSSMGIRTANGGQAILDNRAHEVIKRYAEPPLVLTVDTFYRHHLLEAGDNVAVTHARIPNPKTGLRGLTSELFQILNREARWSEGRMRFTLLWIGGIAAVSAPSSGGAVNQGPPATPTGLALATGTTVDVDGTVQVFLDITWTANTEADLAGYDVRFRRQGDTNYTHRRVPTNALRERAIIANVNYDVQVRAVDQDGNASAYSGTVTILTAKDTTAPAVPAGVSSSAGIDFIVLSWNPVTDADFAVVEIWRSTTNDRATATKVAEVGGVAYPDTGLLAISTYYYWLRSKDTSGNVSAFHTGDLAGLAVTTAGKIGYKLTLNSQRFSGTFVNSVALASVVFDSVDQELDWLVRLSGDLHWGETNPNAVVVTALGSKFLGETAVASGFDGTDHQVATILSDIVRYGKLDRSGSVLTAMGDKFSPGAGDKYVRAAVSARGSSLHWALAYDVGTPFSQGKIRYARTDLSGAVQVAPVDVVTGLDPGEEVRIGVDSDNNAHIFYRQQLLGAFQKNAFQEDAFQAQDATPMKWVKVSNAGAVLAGPTQVFTPPPGSTDLAPAGVLVDGDTIHVIGYIPVPSSGIMFAYGRMDKAGAVVVPATLFYATPTDVTFGYAAIDTTLNQIYVAWASTTGINQMRLDPIDPTGEALATTMPKASL
jgi:hypothetical protein